MWVRVYMIPGTWHWLSTDLTLYRVFCVSHMHTRAYELQDLALSLIKAYVLLFYCFFNKRYPRRRCVINFHKKYTTTWYDVPGIYVTTNLPNLYHRLHAHDRCCCAAVLLLLVFLPEIVSYDISHRRTIEVCACCCVPPVPLSACVCVFPVVMIMCTWEVSI